MRIAMIDDEELEREKLKSLLQEWADQHGIPLEVDLYSDADSLLDTYSPGLYAILFLDIYIEKTDGIETARLIRQKDPSCIIIFLTSSSLHRADAFSVHAFEYLEKPLSRERLSAVMDDAMALLTPQAKSLTLFRGKQSLQFLHSDIRYVLSDKQYCLVQARQDERFRVSFREIEEQLSDEPQFLLINRGILVNMDYVVSMDGLECTMTDGSTHLINTRKQAEIRQAFLSYQFEKRARSIHKQNG